MIKEPCYECNGTGKRPLYRPGDRGYGISRNSLITCTLCNGSGLLTYHVNKSERDRIVEKAQLLTDSYEKSLQSKGCLISLIFTLPQLFGLWK